MDKDTLAMMKQILKDEESLDQLRDKLDHERNLNFSKERPHKPEPEKVLRIYDPVKSQLKPDYAKWSRPLVVTGIVFAVEMLLSEIPFLAVFMALLIFVDIFLMIAAAVYIFYQRIAVFPKEVKADEARIRDSREYKEKCRQMDLEYDKKQEELDREYREKLNAFQREYALWETEYRKWQQKTEEKFHELEKEMADLEAHCDMMYDKLNAIPTHYRRTEIIRYIYNAISTSDYTIKEAIDLYDRNEQRKIDEARLREQQIHNQLQEEANLYADEMNELQREANETAAKTRRDMNIANAANIYQNHKRNKMLDKRKKN